MASPSLTISPAREVSRACNRNRGPRDKPSPPPPPPCPRLVFAQTSFSSRVLDKAAASHLDGINPPPPSPFPRILSSLLSLSSSPPFFFLLFSLFFFFPPIRPTRPRDAAMKTRLVICNSFPTNERQGRRIRPKEQVVFSCRSRAFVSKFSLTYQVGSRRRL